MKWAYNRQLALMVIVFISMITAGGCEKNTDSKPAAKSFAYLILTKTTRFSSDIDDGVVIEKVTLKRLCDQALRERQGVSIEIYVNSKAVNKDKGLVNIFEPKLYKIRYGKIWLYAQFVNEPNEEETAVIFIKGKKAELPNKNWTEVSKQ